MARRALANLCEEKFALLAEDHGWRPCKRGWPDFLCFGPDGEVIAVEVKPRTKSGRHKMLAPDQAACMDFLSANGIRCFVSDGVTLEKYDHATHADETRRRRGTAFGAWHRKQPRKQEPCGVHVEA